MNANLPKDPFLGYNKATHVEEVKKYGDSNHKSTLEKASKNREVTEHPLGLKTPIKVVNTFFSQNAHFGF